MRIISFQDLALETFNDEHLEKLAKKIDRILKPNEKFLIIDCQDITGRSINFGILGHDSNTNQYKLDLDQNHGVVVIRIFFEDGRSSIHKVVVH